MRKSSALVENQSEHATPLPLQSWLLHLIRSSYPPKALLRLQAWLLLLLLLQ